MSLRGPEIDPNKRLMSTPRTAIQNKRPIAEPKKSGPREFRPVFDKSRIETSPVKSDYLSPSKSPKKSLTSSAVRPTAIDTLLLKNTANRDKVQQLQPILRDGPPRPAPVHKTTIVIYNTEETPKREIDMLEEPSLVPTPEPLRLG